MAAVLGAAMSDFFPLTPPDRSFYAGRYYGGPQSSAVLMTKAEIIMRREEALKLCWPLIKIIPGAIVPEDPTPIVPGNELRPRYSELLFGGSSWSGPDFLTKSQQEFMDRKIPKAELLYGGAPGGGMSEWPSCLVPQRRQDHHIACAEQVTGGADRCDCGVRPR